MYIISVQTERDNSVRQKAIDLLYAMCDVTNSETIVAELLSYLGHADYSVREALVSSTEFVCITLSRVIGPWKNYLVDHNLTYMYVKASYGCDKRCQIYACLVHVSP